LKDNIRKKINVLSLTLARLPCNNIFIKITQKVEENERRFFTLSGKEQ
jgi:hypothetical protein